MSRVALKILKERKGRKMKSHHLSLILFLTISWFVSDGAQAGHDGCVNSVRIMSAAHELDESADRFHELVHQLTGTNSLADVAHDLSEAAEHLHQVVEQGADCDHIREDFREVDTAFNRIRTEWHYTNYFVKQQWEIRSSFRNMEHAFYNLRQAVFFSPNPWNPPVPPPNLGREVIIKCRSINYQTASCGMGPAGSVIDVNLISRRSHAPCNKAAFGFSPSGTFGITEDRTSIWVSRGCSGTFSVRVQN